MFLLLRLNTQVVSRATKYIFLQYMQGTPVLDEVDKEPGRVRLR